MFFGLFHKKRTIDDLLKLVNSEVYVRNNIRDKYLEVSFGERRVVHGFNYQTIRSPMRIMVNKDMKIVKIELEETILYSRNEMLSIIKDIKIGSKFTCHNSILMENIELLTSNIQRLGRYSVSDIGNKIIKDDRFKNSNDNFTKMIENIGNFILF